MNDDSVARPSNVLDPLLRDVRCEHSLELPVLGLRTAFESNDRAVIELIEETFGGWRCVAHLSAAAHATNEPLRVRVVVFEGEEPGARPPAIRHIAPDDARLLVHSPGSLAVSDPHRREVIAFVTNTLAAERETFRSAFLEGAILALLSHFDRHPLHAAAVARNGRALLLLGPSGAGKSTLAHLADAAGIDVLSEDHVWVQLDPSVRVWGWPGYARLLTGPGDEKKLTALGGRGRAACHLAERAAVCLLERGTRAALERVDPRAIFDALTRDVAPGFDRFPDRNAAVARALAEDGGWRLTLTKNPSDALPLLESALSEL